MFPMSTQVKNWTFSGSSELTKLRKEANRKFVESRTEKATTDTAFLTCADEKALVRHYEYELKNFCGNFQPPMPHYVVGTALSYFKRFYLHNSVMSHHPKHILYTCVYLAAKVEEFNVSITQFATNLVGDKEKAADVIIEQELLLMHHLHYHLTVHNPFRPLEGLLIDIKSRCAGVDDPEKLRKGSEDFLDRSLSSDVSLIFAPSQIALAAVLSSAKGLGLSLDSYVMNTLLDTKDKENILKAVENVKRIRFIVKSIEPLNREEIRDVERRLESCQNRGNNPDCPEYKQLLEDLDGGEEEEETSGELGEDPARKRRKTEEMTFVELDEFT